MPEQVAQQHVKWLTDADGGAPPTSEEAVQALRGLVTTLIWSTRHGHASLREQVAHYFAAEVPQGAHLHRLLEAITPDGHTVLHALVMAGQGHAASEVVRALPPEQGAALLSKRTLAGALASQMSGSEAPPEQRAAVALASQDLGRLAAQLTSAQSPPLASEGRSLQLSRAAALPAGAATGGATGATAAAACSAPGRGGAVRRRKTGDGGSDGGKGGGARPAPAASPSVPSYRMAVEDDGCSSDGQSKAAGAACELLQLAAAASSVGTGAPAGRARGPQAGARQRDAKPYQRRSGARGGRGGRDAERDSDCWLPGGFWWQDGRTPMPSGRQPGELAGWQPLAGHATQQRLQEQQAALSVKEHFVQGLGSRDDAAAYLQQLGRGEAAPPGIQPAAHAGIAPEDGAVQVPPDPARALMRSADDSEIDRTSEYKSLASWGGFRQHYIDKNKSGGADGSGSEEWKRRIQEQLVQKRAEILAAQRRLESLSLEQQELEKLITSTDMGE